MTGDAIRGSRPERPVEVGLMIPTWTDGSGLPHWVNGRGEAGVRWSTIVIVLQSGAVRDD